jgi:hypothetical protein
MVRVSLQLLFSLSASGLAAAVVSVLAGKPMYVYLLQGI